MKSFVDYEWTNLDIAKKNLDRLRTHYEWYTSNNYYPYKKLPKPDFVYSEYSFKLIMDDGSEISYSPYWVGHFESLCYAKIVIELPKYIV